MDKIYKAIWSKVKNCCVAVSEIAKHNGKDRASVNCCRNERRGAAEAAATVSSFARESVVSLHAVSVQGDVASAVRARVLWGGH